MRWGLLSNPSVLSCPVGRHGHNELDDPQATLPLTYERIQEHPRVLDIYAARLSAQGLIPASLLDSLKVCHQHIRPHLPWLVLLLPMRRMMPVT